MDRRTSDELGKAVRDVWVRIKQNEVKSGKSVPADHLIPWETLDERNKEIDRCIALAVVEKNHDLKTHYPVPFGVRRSVLQDWVHGLTFMQQSVLIASVRGPDGIRKEHPVKVLCRWLRRSFLISAFNREPLENPYKSGGGSFTGPCTRKSLGISPTTLMSEELIDIAVDMYLRSVDELPHHFQLHFMHAAEILGYKHPNTNTREWWHKTYLRLVNDLHLFPESEEQMDKRLGDFEDHWREREEVVAR